MVFDVKLREQSETTYIEHSEINLREQSEPLYMKSLYVSNANQKRIINE